MCVFFSLLYSHCIHLSFSLLGREVGPCHKDGLDQATQTQGNHPAVLRPVGQGGPQQHPGTPQNAHPSTQDETSWARGVIQPSSRIPAVGGRGAFLSNRSPKYDTSVVRRAFLYSNSSKNVP